VLDSSLLRANKAFALVIAGFAGFATKGLGELAPMIYRSCYIQETISMSELGSIMMITATMSQQILRLNSGSTRSSCGGQKSGAEFIEKARCQFSL
jgi:hypothetical protein